jgi:hypothetical protein
MNNLFRSQDSIFSLKTALLVTSIPLLMLSIIVYSVWLMLVMNFSYFRANGLPLDDQSLQDFTNYLLQSQIEYIPFIGLFIIGVFFIGLFLAYITLRPFNQLTEICQAVKDAKGEKVRIVGLGNKKLLIKLGNFLSNYVEANKGNKSIAIPDDLNNLKGPRIDGVFYFQFFCIILILMGVAFSSIYIFTAQLEESITQAALTILKSPKGMNTFISSQSVVFNVILIVPSLISFLCYCFISRMIINQVQGVTYAYVRDVIEVVKGNTRRRLTPREQDPGKDAAGAVNEVLELVHPRNH